MKVERVTATIKHSQDIGGGARQSLEIGAEATCDVWLTWQEAQASLVAELSRQLTTLWTVNLNCHNAKEDKEDKEDNESTELESSELTPISDQSLDHTNGKVPVQPPEHYCGKHKAKFKRYLRGEERGYAHKVGDRWCLETDAYRPTGT